MYKLYSQDPIGIEPWQRDLAYRQEMLVTGKFRIAYYYEEFNDSSFRYRAYNMAEAINLCHSGSILSASYFRRSDLQVFRWLAKTADQLVVCRSGEDALVLELICLFRDQGKPVIFDADDLVVDPGYAKQVAFALGQDLTSATVYDYWHAYFSRMRNVALRCDAVSTTNAYLTRLTSRSLGLPGMVIPNSLNCHQLQASDFLFGEKARNQYARDARFTIGYFSGSPSHRRDFALVSEALAALMDEKDNVDLLICGYIELEEALKRFADRIIYEPFRNFVTLQGLIARCELSIAPLEFSTFTNCKSELKYFEPSVVGTVCVASPTYTFLSSINHNVNGWISRSHEWLDVLRHAVNHVDQQMPLMAQRARTMALNRFGPDATLHALVSAYDLSSYLTCI